MSEKEAIAIVQAAYPMAWCEGLRTHERMYYVVRTVGWRALGGRQPSRAEAWVAAATEVQREQGEKP